MKTSDQIAELLEAAARIISGTADQAQAVIQLLSAEIEERDQRIEELTALRQKDAKLITEKDARIVVFQKECHRLHDCITSKELKIHDLEAALSVNSVSPPSVPSVSRPENLQSAICNLQ